MVKKPLERNDEWKVVAENDYHTSNGSVLIITW